MLQHGGPDRGDRTRGLDHLAGHLDQPWIPSLACGEWHYGGGCAADRVCVEEMRWGSRARAPVYIRRRQPRAWHAWHRLEVRR
jgi:hypothetical protein